MPVWSAQADSTTATNNITGLMPHSTYEPSPLRRPSRGITGAQQPQFKFPAASQDRYSDVFTDDDGSPAPSYAQAKGRALSDRFNGKRDNSPLWSTSRRSSGNKGHRPQPSLSDTLHKIRARRGSVSENMHDVAEALKAPVSPKLIMLCLVWYASSAMTNTSTKSILNSFRKPVTLTLLQFAFSTIYCVLFNLLSHNFPILRRKVPALAKGLSYPSRDIIVTLAPIAGFTLAGHLLSASATSRIPVSLVHTIKGMSPLFTVGIYRYWYKIKLSHATYWSMLPLTLGVVLACSTKFKGNFWGILCSFIASLVFVTQNLFSKRLFDESERAEADGFHRQSRKLDKFNLLCYSSAMAFLATSPIWFYSEGYGLLKDFLADGSIDLTEKPNSFDHGRLAVEFAINGILHFAQSIIAFILISMTSPVTYSVASLLKRVFVVFASVLWFWEPTTPMQAFGIALSFFGAYLYDRAKEGDKAHKKTALSNIEEETLLPLNAKTGTNGTGAQIYASPVVANPYVNGYAFRTPSPLSPDEYKRDDDAGVRGRPRGQTAGATWLAPGTKAETTWARRNVSDDQSRNGSPYVEVIGIGSAGGAANGVKTL